MRKFYTAEAKEANRKYGQTVIMITHDEQIA